MVQSRVLIGLIYVAGLSGCRESNCQEGDCLNGGTCTWGGCQCPPGFGGTRCEIKWSDAWIGSYTVDERCREVGLIPQFDAQIKASPLYPDVIYFEGFGDIACEGQKIRVEARLTNANEATITRQSSCNRRYIVEGRASLNNRMVVVEYSFQDFSTQLRDSCRAEWRKY
ncbi:MAG: calcium-binding EGF-like domain-containing protein [Bacteroidia bacterium]|nr:calcium-binding EGF-like domain-containing protein [Bacteroidia bacterium]MDW8088457.1 calcium-binding EGF-like domain-containing protein [Bacteroidia bacterium]